MGATTLILIMAANTAFADFPRLSALHATDGFLPRQLTYKGSRLVFSRGIIDAGNCSLCPDCRVSGQCDTSNPALRHRRISILYHVAD